MNPNLRKTLIKMSKICIYGMIVQISAYSFAFAVSSRAQDKSVNAIQVQLDLKSPVQLEKVFKQIEKSTDFHFSYVDEQLNSSSYAVDINNSQILLGDLLMNISRQTDLSFRRVNDHIFIAKKEEGIEPIVEDIEMALKITGKITDEKGEPLPGATVLEKGTTNGTTTDLDGKFQLNSSENAILVISFVGYETREVSVNNRSVIDVQLGVDSEQLEEVVVVGYGTQRKSDVTGSLVSLSRDDFDKQPITRIDQALQGRTAGVQVTQSSGAPGSGYKIRIRGVNSISGSNNPLYVIDGMVVGSINSININDIQSMEVLKDASSTAIYGSRGSNGVVMITTKRGSQGKAKINYNASYSTQNVLNKYDLLNATQYAEYMNELDGLSGNPPSFPNPSSLGAGTDWQDEILQNGHIQNHNLSVSGGNNDVRYYISGTVYDQKGIIINSDYQRYSLTSNVDAQLTSRLKAGVNLFARRTDSNRISSREGTSGSQGGGVITSALVFSPVLGAFEDDGARYSTDPNLTGMDNPIAMANDRSTDDITDNLQSSIFAELEIIQGLTFKTVLGTTISNSMRGSYQSSKLIYAGGFGGLASISARKNTSLLSENYVITKVLLDQKSPYLKSVIINKGFKHGIKNGSSVVDNSYYVGKIVDVNHLSSRVLLATDLNSKIPVIIEPGGINAILSGNGNDFNAELEYLPIINEVKDGDIVYTSGIDGKISAAIPVGKIFINKDKKLVKFFTNFSQINFVKVNKQK